MAIARTAATATAAIAAAVGPFAAVAVAAVAVAAVTLVATACDGKPAAVPLPPPSPSVAGPAFLRGALLVRDDSSLVFIACGTVAERPVTAAPSSQLHAAVMAVNGDLRDSAFIEIVADTARDTITVRETRFATSFAEGSRCDRPRTLYSWEALGTEPFWRVTLDSTQVVLERPEPPRELVFEAKPAETRGTLTTIMAFRALGKVHELKLGLLRESCRDGMSDAWYPYRAEVRFGEVALHGCARRTP